jgi:hypothetical protein
MLLGRRLGIIRRSSRHGDRMSRRCGGECFTRPTAGMKERIVSGEYEQSRWATASHAREARLLLRSVKAELSRVRPVVAMALSV